MYDPSEALLQLGLYDYVWGNPSLLQTYNANVQAQKAREEQNRYNMLWKQIELAKMQNEKDKQSRIEKATAQAKVNQLLQGYGYKTPQERSLIDDQITQAAIEGNLDINDLGIQRKKAVNAAQEEMRERSAKNAVLDPIKMEIRQHGLYSSEPDWKSLSKEDIMNMQRQIGLTGTDVDGKIGPKTKKALEAYNAANPNAQWTAPNPLATILGKIDNLSYDFNGERKTFSPAELDELRKMVYGGEDPYATNKKSWEDWGRNQAQNKAAKKSEEKDKKKELAESGRKKIANGQPGRVTIAEQTAMDEGY
jgi:hypothetical protein